VRNRIQNGASFAHRWCSVESDMRMANTQRRDASWQVAAHVPALPEKSWNDTDRLDTALYELPHGGLEIGLHQVQKRQSNRRVRRQSAHALDNRFERLGPRGIACSMSKQYQTLLHAFSEFRSWTGRSIGLALNAIK
jgi:hypothetical protein